MLPDGTVHPGRARPVRADAALRLTWQVTPQNKFAAWCQRIWKRKGHDFSSGTDPRAAQPRDAQHGALRGGAGAVDVDPEQQLLFEGGYSTCYQHPVSGDAGREPKTRVDAGVVRRTRRRATRRSTRTSTRTCTYTTGCTQLDVVAVAQARRRPAAGSGGVGVVCDRDAQRQGGVPGLVRPGRRLLPSATATWSPNYVNNRPQTVTVYNTPIIRSSDSWTTTSGSTCRTPGRSSG